MSRYIELLGHYIEIISQYFEILGQFFENKYLQAYLGLKVPGQNTPPPPRHVIGP